MTATYEVILDEPSRGAQVLTPFIDPDSLNFSSVDPGGFGSVNFQLDRDLDARDYEVNTEILVYDAETNEQVGGGRILNPGRSIIDQGEFWEITTLGEGPVHLEETSIPYVVIDTRLTPNWTKGFVDTPRYDWVQQNQPQASDETINPGWTFVISPGTLTNGDVGRLNYYDMEQYRLTNLSGPRIEIGGYAFRDIEGNGTAANRVQSLLASNSGSGQTTITDIGFQITASIRRRQITTDWPTGGIGPFSDEPVTRLTIRYERTTSTVAVGGDDDWMHVYDLRVSALRVDRNGNPITTAATYTPDFVYAHEAIIDCWARFCPRLDVANARIDTTATYEHRDLVWPDGVTPYGVLEKLMQYDPAFTWAVWERLDNGLYRAEWRARDTDVRYEIPAESGYTQTSSEGVPLRNAFVVAESPSGAYRVSRYSSDLGSEDLDTIGPSKTVKFDGQLDTTNLSEAADALATDTLETSERRAEAAQVTVTGTVFDHYTGRHVTADKIRPGYNARINDVTPDGAIVLRIVTNNHTAADRSSRLELNSYTLTEARAIAALLNNANVTV